MTRKDYINTAKILRKFHPEKNMIREQLFENLVDQFAAMFIDDNFNFDADRFYKDCGL